MNAMNDLTEAKTALRAALLKPGSGRLAEEHADCLIDRYQTALKTAHRERILRETVAQQRKALTEYIDWRGGGIGWPRELAEWIFDPIDPDKNQPAAGPEELALLRDDIATLARIGRLYLDAVDKDPEYEMLTATEALQITSIREAVERQEARDTP